jgi:hypothetical protein
MSTSTPFMDSLIIPIHEFTHQSIHGFPPSTPFMHFHINPIHHGFPINLIHGFPINPIHINSIQGLPSTPIMVYHHRPHSGTPPSTAIIDPPIHGFPTSSPLMYFHINSNHGVPAIQISIKLQYKLFLISIGTEFCVD